MNAFPIGFPTFDKISGGLRPGEILLVTGQAGSGKTVFIKSVRSNLPRSGLNMVFWPRDKRPTMSGSNDVLSVWKQNGTYHGYSEYNTNIEQSKEFPLTISSNSKQSAKEFQNLKMDLFERKAICILGIPITHGAAVDVAGGEFLSCAHYVQWKADHIIQLKRRPGMEYIEATIKKTSKIAGSLASTRLHLLWKPNPEGLGTILYEDMKVAQ